MDKKNKEKLQKLSTEFKIKRHQEKKEAEIKAEKLNIPKKQKLKDGRIIELMEFDGDIPLFHMAENREGGELLNNSDVYDIDGIDGEGEILGMWDEGGVLLTHNELIGRVTQKDAPDNDSDHATHVAGTMIAAGVDSDARGMSYKAHLYAYDWGNDNAEMTEAAINGLKVSQHSYGYLSGWFYGDLGLGNGWYWLGTHAIDTNEDYVWGFYNNHTKEWDDIAYNATEYLIVKSAGNDRGYGPPPGTKHYFPHAGSWYSGTITREKDGGSDGYDSISHKALAKNIMTVGAVDNNGNMANFSGWGPTDDGRIKPDIVAKGVGVYSTVTNSNSSYDTFNGTSMSGPMVSGSIGLILQHQRKLHGGQELLSSTIKGLIIHTADQTVKGKKTKKGPDYEFGWGLMDTKKVIDLMTNNNTKGGDFNIREKTLQIDDILEFNVIAKGNEPLKATITWIDPSGTPVSPSLNPQNLMLVNDLDLRIIGDNQEVFKPFVLDPANPNHEATTGDNFRDNVEMVILENPTQDKEYKVVVTHKGKLVDNEGIISNQNFSLIIDGIK